MIICGSESCYTISLSEDIYFGSLLNNYYGFEDKTVKKNYRCSLLESNVAFFNKF
jgi:hypothetical protein